MKDGMKTITLLAAVLALTLAFAGTAVAQTSSDAYSDAGGQVQAQVQGDGDDDGTGSTGGDGSLPFTGLDLGLVAGGGLLLLGAGIAMRRLTPGTRSA
jgi:hypothetical protein